MQIMDKSHAQKATAFSIEHLWIRVETDLFDRRGRSSDKKKETDLSNERLSKCGQRNNNR